MTRNKKIGASVIAVVASAIAVLVFAGNLTVTADKILALNYNKVIVSGSGTALDWLELDCAGKTMQYLELSGNYIYAHDCDVDATGAHTSHTVLIKGRHIRLEDSLVHGLDKSTGAWGSGVKCYLGGDDVVIKNNKVYNNWGEGIGITRCSNVAVENNEVWDNYSVNIYIDNSYNVRVLNNYSKCTDATYKRDGYFARGILLGNENYSGWGSQLHDVLIDGNTIEACRPIRLYNPINGSTSNLFITNNTFINVVQPFVSVAGAVASNNVAGRTPAIYYVSPTGNDTNNGTSTSTPWKTAGKVSSFQFVPGDTILFQRGGVWSGSGGVGTSVLTITKSGVVGNPIVFGAYGEGASPVFENPPILQNHTRGILIDASWIVVENLTIRNAHEAGVYIGNNVLSEHVVIKNMAISNTGTGVLVKGNDHVVANNYIHDLHMVVNTIGGNDDYGAVGIMLNNANRVDVSYNRVENAISPSLDYGFDGGVVEWWGNSDNNNVHHNTAENNNGFFEVGGISGNHALGNVVAYNLSVNNRKFSTIHLSGTFGVDASFIVNNNTVVDTVSRNPLEQAVIGFVGIPTSANYILEKNIFYLNDYQLVSNSNNFSHRNNSYYFVNPETKLGFALGIGEIMADPLFASDYHLSANSPACTFGAFPCAIPSTATTPPTVSPTPTNTPIPILTPTVTPSVITTATFYCTTNPDGTIEICVRPK